ncbi:MAG TPA: ATP-binding cassette domain-containing protein [Thermoanaerobaculia bacterium]|nr:ATP-binding cassette domain-containing protein [Thermoanaerobaculia bacterium]
MDEIQGRPGVAANLQPKLRVEDLSKSFDGRVVLDGMGFSVADRESLVIVGLSGSGKSVLLKHLIGLLRPDTGTVYVDGQDLWALSPVDRNSLRKKFGMSFQEGALFDSMSVFDNVAFPLRRSNLPPAHVRRRVEECLEIVHLPNVEGKRPSELSGGMRRRVGFARAIAHEPEILLFDEPNTGLDPIMTDIIDEVILEMRQRMSATIVTITHHIPSARKIGDRIALLSGGRLVYNASPEEFLNSNDPAVRQFVAGTARGPLTEESENLAGVG